MPVPPLPNELISLIFEHLYLDLPQTETSPSFPFSANAILEFVNLRLVSRAWNTLAVPFLVRNLNGRRRFFFSALIERYQVVGAVRALRARPPKMPIEDEVDDAVYEGAWKGWVDLLTRCASNLVALELAEEFAYLALEHDRAHPFGFSVAVTFRHLSSLSTGIQHSPASLRSLQATFAACPQLNTLSLAVYEIGGSEMSGPTPVLTCPLVKSLALDCVLSVDTDIESQRNFLVPFLCPVQGTLTTFAFRSNLCSHTETVPTIFCPLTFPQVVQADLKIFVRSLVSNLFSLFPNCHTFSSMSFDFDPDWASFLLPATLTTLTLPIFFEHAVSELSLYLGSLPSSWGAVKRLQIHLEDEKKLTSAVAAVLAVECARLGITLFFDGWMDVDEAQQEELRKVDADMKLFWQEDRIAPDDKNWSEPDAYAESDEYTDTEEEGSDEEEVEEDWDAEDEPVFQHLWSEEKKREMRMAEEKEAGKE